MIDMISQGGAPGKSDVLNSFGNFSDTGNEFIITSAITPVSWMNVLSNQSFCSILNQKAEGFSFLLDPVRNRITRWDNNPGMTHSQGRQLFVKDEETSEIWSINGHQDKDFYDRWEARHGLGYTTITALRGEIECTLTYFVHQHHPMEIWLGRITNKGRKARNISLYSFVEPVMGNALDDMLMRDYYNLFNVVVFNKGTILGTKNQWTKRDQLQVGKSPGNLVWNMKFFFTTSLPIESYECDSEKFYGRNQSASIPEALNQQKLQNTQALGKNAVAVLHSRISLEPSEELPFVVTLGVFSRNEEAPPYVEEMKDFEKAKDALDEVKNYWKGICESVQIETPDPEINRAFNFWLKYQSLSFLQWGDNCMLHESGKAEFSTRDLSQNLFTLLSLAPEQCRKKILDLAAYQYFDGDFSHAIIPLIDRGSRSGHADHQLWLPYLVSQYCRETDDLRILDVMVKYHDRGEASLLDHCVRAIDFVSSRKGSRGLPLILNGDFNEALDHLGREGRGESVWLAMFLVYVMKRFIVLLNAPSSVPAKEKFLREIDLLTNAINNNAWDGAWYHRAFSDDGRPVGSEKSEKGQIFLLPQAWAVLSGVAPRDRGKKALESVLKYLDSPEGTMAMFPPYTQPDQSIGIITRYAPGKRENGGIIKTAALWRIMAECLYGNGNKAYKLLKKHMNLAYSTADQSRFRAEPYFESEYIDGIESSDCGMGSYALKGCSASWIFRLIHDWICGIRLEQRGMKIDPSIPVEWDRLVIKKSYRGAFYTIVIENPHRLQKGVGVIYVDGKEFTSSFIPVFGDGKNHQIRVVLGKETVQTQPSLVTLVPEESSEEAKTGIIENPPPAEAPHGETHVPESSPQDVLEHPLQSVLAAPIAGADLPEDERNLLVLEPQAYGVPVESAIIPDSTDDASGSKADKPSPEDGNDAQNWSIKGS